MRVFTFEANCREAGGVVSNATVVRAAISGLRNEVTRKVAGMLNPTSLK